MFTSAASYLLEEPYYFSTPRGGGMTPTPQNSFSPILFILCILVPQTETFFEANKILVQKKL